MASPSLRTRLTAELERRGVIRVVVSYAVAAFVLLQVAEIAFPSLGLPAWTLTLAVIAAMLGFPIAILAAWTLDLGTASGLAKEASDEEPPDATVARRPPLPSDASVAVLAFEDMSPERDQAFFCDGVAAEILDRLAQANKLRVASRTSSLRFRSQKIDVGEIASRLGVAAVLEGSVRKSGNRVRVSTQLVNAEDGYALWSETFDRELSDIFEIQDEIARKVAEALEVTLGSRTDRGRAPRDVGAYEYYLKGTYYFNRWGQRNVEFAAELFGKAVESDPAYSRAWAALADSYAMIAMYWNATDELRSGADRASRRAIDLAPDLAEAHVSRGLHHVIHDEPEEAERSFERALELAPQLFEALYFYGRVCFQQGNLERAAELFEDAQRARPEDFQAPILLRQVYRSLGREADALEAARRGVERASSHLQLNPDDTRALNLGFGGLVDLGQNERAVEWAERSLAIDGDNADTLYNVACGFAIMGDSERALDHLERACLKGVMIAEWVENDSDLDSLRDQPRFQRILTQLRETEAGDDQD